MNRKLVSGLIVLLVVVGIVAGVMLSKQSASDSASATYDSTATSVTGTTSAPHETTNPGTTTGTTGTTTTTTTGAVSGTYTMANVAKHNSASSCWTTINGGVYDVTAWINQHPGGRQAILSLCGTDGSAAFNDQHGGQRRPESELASFKIGTLAQ